MKTSDNGYRFTPAFISDRVADPSFLRKLHGWATWFWLLMAVPSVLWWSASIPYLVCLSVYAVVTGHWSSWQAARGEEKVQAQIDSPPS